MTKHGMFLPVLAIAVAGAIVVAATVELRSRPAADDSLRTQFYAEYDAYVKAPPQAPSPWSAWRASREQMGHLGKMAHMGPGVLPFLIEEARETHDINLNFPLGIITRISFRHAGWPGADMGDSVTNNRLYIEWWDAGQARTDQMFADAYAAHDTLRMASLGIGALPRAMAKLEAGDDSMLEVVGKITQPMVTENVAADAATCRAWWQANKGGLVVPFPDQKARNP